MKKIIIVAVDKNWAIGKNNQLLYDIPTDMKFFKEKTQGNIVVYGYNTLMSFPNQKPLPNRTNIVMTTKNIEIDNCFVVESINHLKFVLDGLKYTGKDVFICGGASIYNQLLDFCDEAYVTKIDSETSNADVFFPNLDNMANWDLLNKSEIIKDEKSNINICFEHYIRLKNKI